MSSNQELPGDEANAAVQIEEDELNSALFDSEISYIHRMQERVQFMLATSASRSELINMEKSLNNRLKSLTQSLTEKESSTKISQITTLGTVFTEDENFNTAELTNRQNLSDNLPNFNGDSKNWTLFEAEHKRIMLLRQACNQEKFSSLYQSIPKKDRYLLAHINPEDPDMNEAYKVLNGKYNDPMVRNNMLLSEMDTIPHVFNSEDIRQWSKVYYRLKAVISITNVDDHVTRARLFDKILEALPKKFCIQFLKRDELTLKDLEKQLRLHITMLHHSQGTSPLSRRRGGLL